MGYCHGIFGNKLTQHFVVVNNSKIIAKLIDSLQLLLYHTNYFRPVLFMNAKKRIELELNLKDMGDCFEVFL